MEAAPKGAAPKEDYPLLDALRASLAQRGKAAPDAGPSEPSNSVPESATATQRVNRSSESARLVVGCDGDVVSLYVWGLKHGNRCMSIELGDEEKMVVLSFEDGLGVPFRCVEATSVAEVYDWLLDAFAKRGKP